MFIKLQKKFIIFTLNLFPRLLTIKDNIMKTSIFEEIETSYVDDNGVRHLDGYKVNQEEGQVIAYIFNGEVYYTNPEFRYDSLVKQTVKDLKAEGFIN